SRAVAVFVLFGGKIPRTPETKQQRCWLHKTMNILNKLPKSQQSSAKKHIHDIWMAATQDDANQAFDDFVKLYHAKYPKAVECLTKDRDVLLTYYDFPAEHWHHLRTTNPIESMFATVKLRTAKTRGCLSQKTGLAMVYKLAMVAQTKWPRLRGSKYVADIIRGIKFKDGIKQIQHEELECAA
ncbi:MAG: transposase, partial [Coxiellaceae bacterium]|nr:transposase [Coxiellaceae bacterium]